MLQSKWRMQTSWTGRTPEGSHARAIIGNMIVTLETRLGYVPRLSLHADFLGSDEQNFARPTTRLAERARSMEFHPGATGWMKGGCHEQYE